MLRTFSMISIIAEAALFCYNEPMIIRELKLVQFRNYQNLRFAPSEGLTVLIGDNAQGKTNVLEAIGLCAVGRSHRVGRDAQMIQWGQEGSYVGVKLERGGLPRSIEIRLRQKQPKQVNVDGSPIARLGDLMGCLNTVFFSPEDLRLVKDGPSERRRFLDRELSQIRPGYFQRLSAFSRVHAQRNALLKSISLGHAQESALDPWDLQFAEHGSALIAERRQFMQELRIVAADTHQRISEGREELALSYDGDVQAGDGGETDFDALMVTLAAQRREDVRRGLTQRGPQRDDIRMRLDGREARLYASQGQQRSIALSLKLSELALMKASTGESPVLLLDDVLSELDVHRQAMLLEVVSAQQTIITGTSFPETGLRADVYRVEEGRLQPA